MNFRVSLYPSMCSYPFDHNIPNVKANIISSSGTLNIRIPDKTDKFHESTKLGNASVAIKKKTKYKPANNKPPTHVFFVKSGLHRVAAMPPTSKASEME